MEIRQIQIANTKHRVDTSLTQLPLHLVSFRMRCQPRALTSLA